MKSYPTKEKPSALTPPSHQRKTQSKVSLPDNRKSSHSGLVQMANQGKHALQLKALEAMFNSSQSIQKQGLEEEEMLQGKFDTAQKISLEEEEPLQGKFETAQREGMEEEELLQGKFDILQKMSLEEEEPIQGKFETAQREGIEEEELLQGKFETIQKQENNTGLPDNLKSGIENLSGYSMDDVKVHYNSDKPASLQAHAYAQGTEIHIASGQEKHLPHEAWHVVQQKQGRVKPTLPMKGGVNVNDDAGLEKEADVMGARALQMKPKENKSRAFANSVAQKKSNVKRGFGLVDNRPEAIEQRKLQEMAKSFTTQQLKQRGVFPPMQGKGREQTARIRQTGKSRPVVQYQTKAGNPDEYEIIGHLGEEIKSAIGLKKEMEPGSHEITHITKKNSKAEIAVVIGQDKEVEGMTIVNVKKGLDESEGFTVRKLVQDQLFAAGQEKGLTAIRIKNCVEENTNKAMHSMLNGFGYKDALYVALEAAEGDSDAWMKIMIDNCRHTNEQKDGVYNFLAGLLGREYADIKNEIGAYFLNCTYYGNYWVAKMAKGAINVTMEKTNVLIGLESVEAKWKEYNESADEESDSNIFADLFLEPNQATYQIEK